MTSLDDLMFANNDAPRMWRPRTEWHLGWTDHELRWLAQGRPAPTHWDYHREGSRWEHVTYERYRNCYVDGHPNTNFFVWISPYSGHRAVVETCEDCGEKIGGHIGNRRLRALGKTRNDIPLANAGTETHEICARCGSDQDVQLHHWAPKHLFNDADRWPQDYLCHDCHHMWHKVTTPSMNRRAS